MSIFFAKSVHQQSVTMSSSNKRQRSNGADSLHITDLPDGLLVSISSYLAKPSIALFAIVNSQHTSKAILTSIHWSVLDFGDIDKDLAAKLSDDDIDKILRSIGAVNNLKIFKLAGCVNITGRGLDVLRSSVAIQQIDLSLVGKREVPLLYPEPLLPEDIVIPILDDIIGRRGSSLKQLEFPKKWRWNQSTQFTEFLERYNDYLTNQRYRCSKCDRICEDTEGYQWISLERDDYCGIQMGNTCSGCVNHFCSRLDCERLRGYGPSWCKRCEKEYCKSCSASYYCNDCEEEFCNECMEMKTCRGEACDNVLCDDCYKKNCDDCYKKKTCSYCGNIWCGECEPSFRCNSDYCREDLCSECFSGRSREVGLDKASKCECSGRLAECGFL